jgi:ferredoxin
MALKTARFDTPATVEIDASRCSSCGACAQVCRGAPLVMRDGQVHIDQSIGFGCIGCGQCMTVCPKDAIRVTGRDLGPADLLPWPEPGTAASYDALRALLATRRSVRDFADRPVEPALVEQILDATASAPMGLPPSDVRALVFHGRDRVRAFRDELLAKLKTWRWMTHGVGALVMRPFLGKATASTMRDFVGPVIDSFVAKDRQGIDWFLYDAPLAIYFHAAPCADPADPVVAATYAMIAAHSLGLGTTMLGFPGIVMKQSADLKRKYGVDRRAEAGLLVIFGHPALRYRRTLRRRLGQVRYWGETSGTTRG